MTQGIEAHTEGAATAVAGASARTWLALRWPYVGVVGVVLAATAFLLHQLMAWPPHEDETLALFVGRESLPDLFRTVQGERGGAPLHFLFAWLVVHMGGGLEALRMFSALFAVASVPVIAALGARVVGRVAALVATALVSASWMLLFHGVYGRMYSLFLFTSALSYLALLRAVERGGRRDWALWGGAMLATIAAHPYGALVLASQGLYVLARARTREAIVALGVVSGEIVGRVERRDRMAGERLEGDVALGSLLGRHGRKATCTSAPR